MNTTATAPQTPSVTIGFDGRFFTTSCTCCATRHHMTREAAERRVLTHDTEDMSAGRFFDLMAASGM